MKIDGPLTPNIPIRRLVSELSIECSNNMCEIVIKKCDMSKHLADCVFTQVECPNNPQLCGRIIRRDLERHT
jgi:hypothetical protein